MLQPAHKTATIADLTHGVSAHGSPGCAHAFHDRFRVTCPPTSESGHQLSQEATGSPRDTVVAPRATTVWLLATEPDTATTVTVSDVGS